MFQPIRTARLLIRGMVATDAEEFWRRRSDPEVARHQNWALPYPRETAERIATEVGAMDGPENGEWWMATVVDPETGDQVGELALHLSEDGHTAEVGYTLARRHWGRGYAVEAVEALVRYLFETLGVTRAFGMLHPDNRASAMVLERTGFLFEGHTRSSYWVGDEVSDDWIYGMTREDWEAWRDRPRIPPGKVRLVEVTPDNLMTVLGLATHKTQESFVAPMGKSLAQALTPPVEDGHPLRPWFRAIEADGVIVGFVMLALSDEHVAEPFLWRLLIDRMHQRRGVGRRALDLVEDEMRTRGTRAVMVSWVDGKGSPGPFYEGRGYVRTGEKDGDEAVARKGL
ncbi:MAG TPA: GNAT family N-acetyltransferase [Acidimicrobiia bacterium]|nr:GNAT family N-acetyltransferase [Acidimicrobiia bacterium]